MNRLIETSENLIEYYGDFVIESMFADGNTSIQFFVHTPAELVKEVFEEFLMLIDRQNFVPDDIE